jgi:hypothetical protein
MGVVDVRSGQKGQHSGTVPVPIHRIEVAVTRNNKAIRGGGPKRPSKTCSHSHNSSRLRKPFTSSGPSKTGGVAEKAMMETSVSSGKRIGTIQCAVEDKRNIFEISGVKKGWSIYLRQDRVRHVAPKQGTEVDHCGHFNRGSATRSQARHHRQSAHSPAHRGHHQCAHHHQYHSP